MPIIENEAPAPPVSTISEPPLRELLNQHSGLALTALYLLLIAIGMMYEWWLFIRFGVNILYYAQASDFILVPFREPLVILVSLAPIPLYSAYMRGARWLGQKLRPGKGWEAKPDSKLYHLRPAMNVLAIVLWSFAATAQYADWVATRIRSGLRKPATIELTADNGVTPKQLTGPVIGTTSQFLFVYDPATQKTRIINFGSVAEVVVEPRRRMKGEE